MEVTAFCTATWQITVEWQVNCFLHQSLCVAPLLSLPPAHTAHSLTQCIIIPQTFTLSPYFSFPHVVVLHYVSFQFFGTQKRVFKGSEFCMWGVMEPNAG